MGDVFVKGVLFQTSTTMQQLLHGLVISAVKKVIHLDQQFLYDQYEVYSYQAYSAYIEFITSVWWSIKDAVWYRDLKP